jgi:hypothetical protein
VKRRRDHLFADPGAVDVGGVDQRDAELDRALQDADAFLAIVDDAHCTEAEAVDHELTAEKERGIHWNINSTGSQSTG